MGCYHDLNEFERGVVVGTREMRHSISEIARRWWCSRRPFHECAVNIGNPVKHQIFKIAAVGKRSSKNGINGGRRESFNVTEMQPLRKLLRISMLGHQQVSACEPFNKTSSIWTFRAEGPLVYPYWLHDTKLYASPGHINTNIVLLMTGIMLPGLTSLVSNCIE